MRILVTITSHPDSAAGSMAEALQMAHDVETFDYSRFGKPFGHAHPRANAAITTLMDAAPVHS
jgi:hypothetical protein